MVQQCKMLQGYVRQYNLITTPSITGTGHYSDLKSDVILNVIQLTQKGKYQFRTAAFLGGVWVNNIKWIMVIITKIECKLMRNPSKKAPFQHTPTIFILQL